MEGKTAFNEEHDETLNNKQMEEEKESIEKVEASSEDTSDTGDSNERIKDLEQSVIKIEQEKSEIEEKLLRIHAEFDNYKKRTVKEKTNDRKYKAQELATELLPVLDNFERALQSETSPEQNRFQEGMQMIYEQLQAALKSQGVEEIEALHQPFDPNFHHAVMQTDDENHEANVVVEQLQKGYLLNDKVIRPAMVKVNK